MWKIIRGRCRLNFALCLPNLCYTAGMSKCSNRTMFLFYIFLGKSTGFQGEYICDKIKDEELVFLKCETPGLNEVGCISLTLKN